VRHESIRYELYHPREATEAPAIAELATEQAEQ
jgi:hypothetical protein